MTSDDIGLLAADAVQQFVFFNTRADESKLLLRGGKIEGLPAAAVVQQIVIRRKAEDKIPLYFNTPGIVYPPTLNWEQASSEAAAAFKAEFMQKELPDVNHVVDLTGGLGIDSFYLGQKAKKLNYVEPDATLLKLARHNHETLGYTGAIYRNDTAEHFLEATRDTGDLFYIDPSRRSPSNKKVFQFADCSPDIKTLLPTLLERAKFVLVKASPMLDLQQGINDLGHVKKVVVLAIDNECKELLFLLQKGPPQEPVIEAIHLNRGASQGFSFRRAEEEACSVESGEPGVFVYEPNASILKAGAFKLTAHRFDLKKVAVNTHLYTSNELRMDFPGRIFRIEQKQVDERTVKGKKANVLVRNFPLSADALKKKLKVVDGGDAFVLGFSGGRKKYVMWARRVV